MTSKMLLILSLLALSLGCDSRPRAEAMPTEAPAPAPPSVAPAKPQPAAKATEDCDAWPVWQRAVDSDDKEAVFIQAVSGWTTECRADAMRRYCRLGCDDFLSDLLVAAEVDKGARLDLIRVRLEMNRSALVVAQPLFDDASELGAYANRIRAAPRGVNAKCGQRMREDHAKVNAQNRRNSATPSFIAAPIGGALAFMRMCLDCTDERWACDDMNEHLATAKEAIRDMRKAVAKDEKALRLAGRKP